eukprot:CAMPEP_0197825086 /NCGR_PEP_ID=MMETSP1437-20131217/2223_1 /TAXON_ID=49252 ORGANISM="Eucampia antarctica, Strain CCMP1452" /NCGR_SAMPLE_ID=MMETSP1437 /ASSEMBLY_ACC=CAM_ASM_001096 /LENGTH=141 /DNA_ID=CAMNT_0043424941 /DNA_START=91 /DNA_END=513 /DNA_ORIENTATION=-
MTMMLNLLRRRLIALSSASAAMSMMMTMTMMLLLLTMNDHGGVGVVSAAPLAEHLSTFEENNFSDRGNSVLSTSSTYSYDLANGYIVDLTGWSHTRNFAYGFVRNSAGSPNPTAVVSGMVPGGIYAFKVYQYATTTYAGAN